MLEIVRIDPPWESNETEDNEPRWVHLRGEMENIEVDDEIFGYLVTKIQAGRHDGFPATQFTLADACGEREVGRLIIRNGAYQDALPEWVRIFPEPQGTGSEARLDDFLYEAGQLGEIPAGFHFIPARKIDVGDVCRDEMAGYETEETVIGVRYGTTPTHVRGTPENPGLGGVVAGAPMVEFQYAKPDGELSGWVEYGLDHMICRKD